MTIRLADILETIEEMRKPAAWNDDQVRPLLMDTFKKQVEVTLALHLSNMKNANNDDYVCYKYSDKLRGNIWDMYSLDALNTTVRENYAMTLSLKGKYNGKLVFQWDYISKVSQMIFQQKPRQTKEKSI